MDQCEIIYIKDAKGWKWRALTGRSSPKWQSSEETFRLYYECVLAARARGYVLPAIKCR